MTMEQACWIVGGAFFGTVLALASEAFIQWRVRKFKAKRAAEALKDP